VRAHEVRPGDWVRWYGDPLRVERVHCEAASTTVSLYAGAERILLGWDDPVELVDAS
jgi:hypothetical protein